MVRKLRIVILISLVGLLVLAACAPAEPAAGTPAVPTDLPSVTLPAAETPTAGAETPAETPALAGTAWQLESLGETPALEGAQVSLEFESDSQAGGSGGCNSYSAAYEVEGNAISFESPIATLMACTAQGVMDQEQQYFMALAAAAEVELTGERLTLRDDSGQVLLTFVPKAAEEELESTPTETESAGGGILCDLQVADDPNSLLCHSKAFGFELEVPAGSTSLDQSPSVARIGLPITKETNLSEKYLVITVTEGAATCTSPLVEGFSPGTVPTEKVAVGELSFIRQSGQDAGAGNRYDWTAYSTAQSDRCVSLGFVMHSFVAELAATPPPEYDAAAESAVFDEILASFRWLRAGGEETPTPERITFAAGGTSAELSGVLPASGSALYVLEAMQGQTMTVDLSFTAGRAILAVWGADGGVLLSDHAEASGFSGELPSTQDYFILLKGSPEQATEYRMLVTIPPLG